MHSFLFRLANIFPEPSSVPHVNTDDNLVTVVLKLVFAFAGTLAVFIITLAGFQYVMSQGDPQRVAKAKNTIIYALVGLVICIAGYSIVNFIIGRL